MKKRKMKRNFATMILMIAIILFTGCTFTTEKSETTVENSSNITIEELIDNNSNELEEATEQTTTTEEATTTEKATETTKTTETMETTATTEITTTTETTTTEITTTTETTTTKFAAEYVVQANDTLYSIAARNDVSIEALKVWNGLNSNDVFEGQILYLPGRPEAIYSTVSTNTSEETSSVVEYTVQTGDTLYAIAVRHGLQEDTIKRYNGMTTDTVYVGKILYLPGASEAIYGSGGGCVITEKHDHSLPVSYAGRGDEASVSWGSWDLRFYNPSSTTDLVFYTSTDAGARSCTITCVPQ